MKNYFKLLLVFVLIALIQGCKQQNKSFYKDALVVKGGTIIDVSNNGISTNDLKDKAVIIKADTIFAIVDASQISKKQPNVINARGKFIMPGLTDGFTVLNNQSYANAFLYMGITDIVGVESERRGPFYHDANPAPNIHMLDQVGEDPVTDAQIIDSIAKQAKKGIEVLLLMYKLNPHQIKLALNEAKKYGMGTIGELGYTTYKEGMDLGIDAFVHTTRYSLDIASDSLHKKVAKEPFSNDLGSPKWRYYKMLTELKSDDKALLQHAKNLAASNTYIQPTFSLLYLNMPFSKNPWHEKVAQIINAKDINRPADKITGKHSYGTKEQEAYNKTAQAQLLIERQYFKAGAKYLSGSAADVWGTMPGTSLHQELEVLHRIGLTNRQVLAASTSNFNAAYGFKFGKIKKGFKANILILDKNPLDTLVNLKNGKRLLLNGKEINLKSLLKK
ncbi:MAG: hypothetical protein QM486_00815 [Flavobacteriaceae bacterium]